MYNNPYISGFNSQSTRDRIDSQIAQLQQMKEQLPQSATAPAINQTFQLAPSNNAIKYVNSIDDVRKEIVYADTPFFSNDLSVVWLKNNKGSIKAYELKEIVAKDEKDVLIDTLQLQINELKEMINNAKSNITNVDGSIKDDEPSNVSNDKSSKTKSKSN